MLRTRFALAVVVLLLGCGSRTALQNADAPAASPDWILQGTNLAVTHVGVDDRANVYAVVGGTGGVGDVATFDNVVIDADAAFVTKRNVDGTSAWMTEFRAPPGPGSRFGINDYAVDPRHETSYIAAWADDATSLRHAVFIRLDEKGAIAWRKDLGNGAVPRHIAVGANGEGVFFVSLDDKGSIDFGDGPRVADGRTSYVVAFDVSGALLWTHAVVLDGDVTLGRMAIDGDGRVTLAGGLVGTAKIDGQPITAHTSWDRFVATFDATGALRWTLRVDGFDLMASSPDDSTNVGFDAAGNLYLSAACGRHITIGDIALTSSNNAVFVARIDHDGKPVRAAAYEPGWEVPQVTSMGVSPEGAVMLGLAVRDFEHPDTHVMLARWTPDLTVNGTWPSSPDDAPLEPFAELALMSTLDVKRVALGGAFAKAFSIGDVSIEAQPPSGEGARFDMFLGELSVAP